MYFFIVNNRYDYCNGQFANMSVFLQDIKYSQFLLIDIFICINDYKLVIIIKSEILRQK
ncbi:hypothetical protein SALWKB2_0309 [Snodgrassella alvi wkB2]|nr:hypothetical protein SALWKB2_0309 [Snodgrassella alvi wkB2]